jgi:hypothetical protein
LLIARCGYTPVFIITATLYILAICVLWGAFRHYEGTKRDMMKRALEV